MFTGGIYKHDLVMEPVEDLGGYILQKNVTQRINPTAFGSHVRHSCHEGLDL